MRPKITIRIDFDNKPAIGCGKIKLLELIDQEGSISSAGKKMGMSYRKAWLLIDELNHMFNAPLVIAQHGGNKGGTSVLTELGRQIIATYRNLEEENTKLLNKYIDFFNSIKISS